MVIWQYFSRSGTFLYQEKSGNPDNRGRFLTKKFLANAPTNNLGDNIFLTFHYITRFNTLYPSSLAPFYLPSDAFIFKATTFYPGRIGSHLQSDRAETILTTY
jgi:hypothetical protein